MQIFIEIVKRFFHLPIGLEPAFLPQSARGSSARLYRRGGLRPPGLEGGLHRIKRQGYSGGNTGGAIEPFSRTPEPQQANCGLCEKNCPLSAPACRKGLALASGGDRRTLMDAHSTQAEKQFSSQDLIAAFRRAVRLMKRGLPHHHGFSRPSQGRALSILREKGSVSRKELMELLDLRSGSMSELLGKLERQGLVSRRPDENDKRGFIFSMTEEGRANAPEHGKWLAEHADVLFSSLSDEERQQLGGILGKLADAWEAAFGDEGPDHEHGRGRGGPHGHGPHAGHGRERRHGPAHGHPHEHERGPHGRGRGRRDFYDPRGEEAGPMGGRGPHGGYRGHGKGPGKEENLRDAPEGRAFSKEGGHADEKNEHSDDHEEK